MYRIPMDDAPTEGNFVLDQGGHMMSLYSKDRIYKFTPDMCDAFRRSTPQPRSVLIPDVPMECFKYGFPKVWLPKEVPRPRWDNICRAMSVPVKYRKNLMYEKY